MALLNFVFRSKAEKAQEEAALKQIEAQTAGKKSNTALVNEKLSTLLNARKRDDENRRRANVQQKFDQVSPFIGNDKIPDSIKKNLLLEAGIFGGDFNSTLQNLQQERLTEFVNGMESFFSLNQVRDKTGKPAFEKVKPLVNSFVRQWNQTLAEVPTEPVQPLGALRSASRPFASVGAGKGVEILASDEQEQRDAAINAILNSPTGRAISDTAKAALQSLPLEALNSFVLEAELGLIEGERKAKAAEKDKLFRPTGQPILGISPKTGKTALFQRDASGNFTEIENIKPLPTEKSLPTEDPKKRIEKVFGKDINRLLLAFPDTPLGDITPEQQQKIMDEINNDKLQEQIDVFVSKERSKLLKPQERRLLLSRGNFLPIDGVENTDSLGKTITNAGDVLDALQNGTIASVSEKQLNSLKEFDKSNSLVTLFERQFEKFIKLPPLLSGTVGTVLNLLGAAKFAPKVSAYNAQKDAFVGNLVKVFGGENTSRLSDKDIDRVRKIVPTVTDSVESAKRKFAAMKYMLDAGRLIQKKHILGEKISQEDIDNAFDKAFQQVDENQSNGNQSIRDFISEEEKLGTPRDEIRKALEDSNINPQDFGF